MREQILDNIRVEVRNFLRNGKPMPKRDPKWNLEIERITKEETKILNQEQEEEIQNMYSKFYDKHVSGISYEEWLEKSKKLYQIAGDYVISIARGPEHPETSGPFKTDKAKHKRIIKLISYKYRDHFKRGNDFAYDPDNSDSETK